MCIERHSSLAFYTLSHLLHLFIMALKRRMSEIFSRGQTAVVSEVSLGLGSWGRLRNRPCFRRDLVLKQSQREILLLECQDFPCVIYLWFTHSWVVSFTTVGNGLVCHFALLMKTCWQILGSMECLHLCLILSLSRSLCLSAGGIPPAPNHGPTGKTPMDDSYSPYGLMSSSESPTSPLVPPESWAQGKSPTEKISNGTNISWPPGEHRVAPPSPRPQARSPHKQPQA